MAKNKKKRQWPGAKTDLKFDIEQLEFYCEYNIRHPMQSLTYAMSFIVNKVNGTAGKIGRALELLEQVAVATEKHIAALKAKCPAKKEDKKPITNQKSGGM